MSENLWVFSFEYAGIKKVGGLGEVPANQAKWLANEYNITLFMPSHGAELDEEIKARLGLYETGIEFKTRFNALPYNLGDVDEEIHIGFYEGEINNVKTILLVGKNQFSLKVLGDPVVYGPETITGKFILFSLGVKYYTQNLTNNKPEALPDIIHCHDHHSVPAMINVRQQLKTVKKDAATVITIHLLTWPRKSLQFFWDCGLEDKKMDIYIENQAKTVSMRELYDICKDNPMDNASLEKLGALFADMVTSVSENYLRNDIVRNLGGSLIANKSEFFWNGCDWDYDNMKSETNEKFEEILRKIDDKHPFRRSVLRKYILTQGLGDLPPREPVVDSLKVRKFLNAELTDYPYKKDSNGKYSGKVEPFKDDGPLIMMTGRLSKMKGIDTLLQAVPIVLKVHPNAKFVLFLIPSEFSLNELRQYLAMSKQYKDNVRILFGKVFSMFFPIHLAADLYCCPSRWEPFGIIALEAMVSRVPVVTTRVGGLQESIIDLRQNPRDGTGLLTSVDHPQELAANLIDLISVMKLDELNRNGDITDEIKEQLVSKIKGGTIRAQITKSVSYGSRLRNNCANRVESTFRWKQVSKKLIDIYRKAKAIR